MPDFTRDLRYAFRRLLRSPRFSATAVILIAIGIAANTQIFTLVNALLLRPLPVHNPQNLVQLFEQQPKRPAEAYFDYRFYRQLMRSSSTLFAFAGQIETTRALSRNGHAERIHASAVTEGFFHNLAVTPLLGRTLHGEDRHVVVLSYPFWSSAFARAPSILGQTVSLQGHPYTIAGVMPEAFTGTTVDSGPDLWMPYANLPDFSSTPNPNLDNYVIEIIARLRPGKSLAQAQQETEALWNRQLAEAPGDLQGLKRGKLEVQSIARGVSSLRGPAKSALELLLAGTGLLLLMVCANAGGLFLSRSIDRERETAIRLALGASPIRILGQWVMESLLLTTAGGCLGILTAILTMPILVHWMPPVHGIGFDPAEIRTSTLHLSLDFRVAAVAFSLCVLTTLLCAMSPAWNSLRPDSGLALKSAIGDRRNRFFHSLLCCLQIAFCTTLLVSAGLIVRSLSNLRAADPGFNADHVIVFSVDPHVRGYDSRQTWALQQRLLSKVRNLPGVADAALANRALMRGIGLGNSVIFPGQGGTGVVNTSINAVTPEYFAVMGMRLLSGRNFGPSDMAEEDKLVKVVVNLAFAREFLNGRNPLGKAFATGQQYTKPKYEIIGVVNDTKYRSLREVPPPIFYTYGFGPNAYPDSFILHVRTHGDPHAIVEPVRQLLRWMDPDLPLYQVATLKEEVDQSLWQERLLAALTSSFGVFALLLSAIGLYGVLSYFVARRRWEIGMHLALGANSAHVAWLVFRRVIPALFAGIAAGELIASVAGTWVGSLLYGIQPFDLQIDIAAPLLVIAIGLLAASAPAYRALRLDAAQVLRQE